MLKNAISNIVHNDHQLLRIRDESRKTYYREGDEVFLLFKRLNGYPKKIVFNKIYFVNRIHGDFIDILEKKDSLLKRFKINKKYIISKSKLREINIDLIIGK